MSGNNIMSLFSGAPHQQMQQSPQQQPQPSQGQQVQAGGQQIPPQQDPVAAIAATAGVGGGGGGQQPTGAQAQPNPLDSYTDMFKMPDTSKGTQLEALDAPLFTTDQAAMQKAMSESNFVQLQDPAVMQRAMGGDSQAMTELLNSVARTVMSQSTQLMQRMVEGGVSTYGKRLDGHLPQRMKEFTAKETLSSNPANKHPASSPMISALVQQAMTANPALSVQDAVKQAEGFMQAFASQYVKPPTTPIDPMTGSPKAASQDTDWGQFFN